MGLSKLLPGPALRGRFHHSTIDCVIVDGATCGPVPPIPWAKFQNHLASFETVDGPTRMTYPVRVRIDNLPRPVVSACARMA